MGNFHIMVRKQLWMSEGASNQYKFDLHAFDTVKSIVVALFNGTHQYSPLGVFANGWRHTVLSLPMTK